MSQLYYAYEHVQIFSEKAKFCLYAIAVHVKGNLNMALVMYRAVEIPCPTCPTWSHFIQDKLKISIYLSLDKYRCIKLIQFCISYFD